MGNPWFDHLAAFRKANPNLSMKQCMKAAKKTYKKVGTAKVSKSHMVKKSSKKARKSSKKSRKSRKSSKKARKSSKNARKSRKHKK
jgi:hypothetical protein